MAASFTSLPPLANIAITSGGHYPSQMMLGWMQSIQAAIQAASSTQPGNANTITGFAPAALAAGALVYWTPDGFGGVNVVAASAQTADPTNAAYAPANGFVLTATPLLTHGVVVYLPGQWITGFTGLTPGALYWLDVNPGGVVAAPPQSFGLADQPVGWADTTGTKLFFFPQRLVGASGT